jgi:hypothetical protein
MAASDESYRYPVCTLRYLFLHVLRELTWTILHSPVTVYAMFVRLESMKHS